MNILLTTYPEAFLYKSSGEYELEQLSLDLTKVGIKNSVYSHLSQNIKNFTHVIHFSTANSSLPLLHGIRKRHDCKILLWPLYWPGKDRAKPSEEFINFFDGIIFKSLAEKKHLLTDLTLKPSTILLPPFVDDNFFNPTTHFKNIFKTIYNLDSFNLWVGQLSPEKGQLEFIRTIKNIRQKFVFIGDFSDPSYYAQCIQEGSNNCLFIDQLPLESEILHSSFIDCDRYIELSNEPAGSSALEASLCPCPMLISNDEWSQEFLSERANLAFPSDANSILGFLQKDIDHFSYKTNSKIVRSSDAIQILLKNIDANVK
jgi:glycosyltransferase involved in cell wall biosynthesis